MYYIHGVFKRAAREKAIKETYFVAMQETSSKLLVLTIRWIVRSFLRLTLREPLYCSSSVSMGLQLVDVTPCIDFNGTDFVAQDCDTITAPVTFVNGELVAGTACSTGVNSFSDITISATGEGCATFTATTVPRVIDNAGTLASTDVVSVATTADAVATDVASTSTSGAVTRFCLAGDGSLNPVP
ncbi:hypothetical protein BT96DRAFT_951006 [Gymnopus androsaceus JB14]|uniref:Uncharacterized protein n=1 Tax=Gymnopus androsaceus JB14 TaxID=1447944 RepID=A0A6A4GEQ4_9AGAR|nr:hypothetical protein BT96DRAFT_951006 [Gymnopus androsaceus JB14]